MTTLTILDIPGACRVLVGVSAKLIRYSPTGKAALVRLPDDAPLHAGKRVWLPTRYVAPVPDAGQIANSVTDIYGYVPGQEFHVRESDYPEECRRLKEAYV